VPEATVTLRPWQYDVWQRLDTHRFAVLVVHRRGGKTVLCCLRLLHEMLEKPGGVAAYIAPQYAQAERVVMAMLTGMLPPGSTIDKSKLKITLPNQAVIYLLGGENPNPLRGLGLDLVILDEVAQMPSSVWTEVIRPTLADTGGRAIFIGTPMGMSGLFYRLFTDAPTLPGWMAEHLPWDRTQALPLDEIEALRREMRPEAFEQEMECSFQAAVRGAYWGTEMAAAEKEGRIGGVPHDPAALVHVSWDLGMADSTAIWYWQVCGREIHAIRYEEYQNTGLPEIVRQIKTHAYNWGDWIAPHDIAVRELGSGRSRREMARDLGVEFVVAPNWRINDGIEAFRSLLPRIWFDREHCQQGIEALKLYRADFQGTREVFSKNPLHDWTSHAADSARYFAVTFDERKVHGQLPPLRINYAGTI
jgi:phage terminase large subunit